MSSSKRSDGNGLPDRKFGTRDKQLENSKTQYSQDFAGKIPAISVGFFALTSPAHDEQEQLGRAPT